MKYAHDDNPEATRKALYKESKLERMVNEATPKELAEMWTQLPSPDVMTLKEIEEELKIWAGKEESIKSNTIGGKISLGRIKVLKEYKKMLTDWEKEKEELGKKIKNTTIMNVRTMTDFEMKEYGWDDEPPTVIELSNGINLFASRDDEGNGPGRLFGVDIKTREGYHFG